MASGSASMLKPIGIVGGSIAALIIVVMIIRDFRHLGSTGDPLADAMNAELERQGVTAAFHAKLSGVTDTLVARKYGSDLARKGIPRLSLELLAEREGILLHLDSIAGDTLCAGHFMGTLQPAQLRGFIGLLDSTRLRHWAAISVAAMKSQLESTVAVAPPTPDQVGAVLRQITAQVPDADRERFTAIFGSMGTASLADQCWASKMTTATALGMPDSVRESVLRTMAMVEAGS